MPFFKNVAILSGGTLVARLVAVASFPILTRLFTPEQFGVLSVFVAFVTFGIALGTLSYDWSIPLPRDKEQSAHLLAVSLAVAFGTATASFLVLLWAGDGLVGMTSTPALEGILLLAPAGALASSTMRAVHFWNVKTQAFRPTAIARVGQALLTTGAQLASGVLGLGALGLVLSDGVGRFAGAVLMITQALLRDGRLLVRATWRQCKAVAWEYRRFPLFSSWSSLVTALGQQLPTLALAATFGPRVAGFMALGTRVVSLPMELVGGSVADVFLGEAAQLLHGDPRRLRRRFWQITRKTSWAALPFGLGGAGAPFVFGWIFGSEWIPAGVFVAWLAAPRFAQFVVVSTSNLPAYGKNHWQLVWESVRLILSMAAISTGYLLDWSATATVALLGIVWTLLYGVLFGLNLLALHRLPAGEPHSRAERLA